MLPVLLPCYVMMSRKSMANSAPTYIAPATGAMGVSTAATGVVIGSSTSTGSGLAGQGEGQEQLSFFERERERLIDEISGVCRRHARSDFGSD